jgi:hypothetical protein
MSRDPLSFKQSNATAAIGAKEVAMSADDPITLKEACKLFPRAHLTPSTLRAERDRRRLKVFRLGRRDYTTEADMRAMVKSSKDESSRRVYASTTNADNGEQARSAAAALSQITSALKRSG